MAKQFSKERYPNKLEQTSFDFIIIGGGASGVSAATRASELDISILLVNAGLPIGGTCVNVGCVPSKILIEMANNYYYSQFQHYDSILGKCACISDADFAKSVEEKDEMVKQLRTQNYINPLDDMENVSVLTGYAKFINPNEIEVSSKKYTGDKILIATGSSPKIPPISGLNEIDYLTSDEALTLDDIPSSLIIIGAGPTGLELGQMFHHFGSDVKILEQQDQILPGVEREIADELFDALLKEELQIYLNTEINELKKNENQIEVLCKVSGETKRYSSEEILITTGVKPNSDKLGLSSIGVETDKNGFIQTNDLLQTTVDNIWAAGDIVGNAFLETIAAREGFLAAGNMFFQDNRTINYENIPRAVFTTPNLAVVGLSEQEALKIYEDIQSRTIRYLRIPKAVALKETFGKVKMIIDNKTRKILGIHMVAQNAAEIITEAHLIIKQGLTVDEVINTIHVFPTMSEGIKKAAQAFIRDVSKMACCIE